MGNFLRSNIAKWIIGLAILLFGVASVSVFAREGNFAMPNGKSISYLQMMRQIKDGNKADAVQNLDQFVKSEKFNLDKLGVSNAKQKKYFGILETQKKMLEEGQPQAKAAEPAQDVKMPKNPAKFQFSNDNIIIHKLDKAAVIPQKGQKLSSALLKLVTVETAEATAPQFMPTIEDVQADGKEIVITPEIRELAASLNDNPVKIFNWVRNSITYEPYYGAKKGSVGCLQERVCNDVDASSLMIAILRAAGIPARYEKSAAVFTVEQLRNLLGVAETKTAFAAFCINKVPAHTLSDRLNGVPLDEADFGPETHLALEWTHVQLYYDYDQRGANIDNFLNLASGTTTDAIRTALQQYPKKQWIPVDVIVKPYAHTQKNVLADQANFDTEGFWNGFFQYQGNLSPIAKYGADLLAATGQNVADNLSTKSSPAKKLDVLPITLPYVIASGVSENVEIPWVQFSLLPDAQRTQVKISLRRETNNEVLLSRTFFGSEINNAKVDLRYDGLTDVDKAVIEENGGIYATPAALVDIAPYFQSDDARYEGVEGANGRLGATIGDALVLKFEYIINGESIYNDEKFSVAGNQEGIFVTLSKVRQDLFLDDVNNTNRNSHVLLDGNAALAREYLKRVQEDGNLLKQSLDYEYNLQFGRAVVTQSRILSKVDGVPTTFEFKGLSLDAAADINDYSNRDNYKTHRKDFRLLWGEQASYMEGQIFNDVSGLNGISTVKGLQFAYSQPGTYAMHRITAANEGEIDQLQLSDNTKVNMHADVATGNTIITPDRMVQNQTWNGILYVSLRPDWTAQYAIGEQVAQNGSWTTDTVQIQMYCDQDCKNTYQKSDGVKKFIYADREVDSVLCSISEDTFLRITTNENVPADALGWEKWSQTYGAPCMEETKQFGTVSHTFVLATDGAKFYSPSNYNYWVHRMFPKAAVAAQTANFKEVNFKFNPIAGTYSHNIAGEAVYYRPVQPTQTAEGWMDNGRGWKVDGSILSKLMESPYSLSFIGDGVQYGGDYWNKNNWVLNKLGYPTDAQKDAAPHVINWGIDTTGEYQDFIGGQIYINESGFNETFYVPGEIEQYYNQETCYQVGSQNICGVGSAGQLGFPISDPFKPEDSNELLQKFEWRIVNYTDPNNIELVGYDNDERRTNNKKYAEKVRDKVVKGELTDIEAFALLSDYLAFMAEDNEQYVRDFTTVLTGSESLLMSELTKMITLGASKISVDYDGNPAPLEQYRILRFSDTGFKFEYADSYYCMDPYYECISNQLYHSMAGFAMAYLYTIPTSVISTYYHEYQAASPNPLGYNGSSANDINLGTRMAILGERLRLGLTSREDAGQWILNNIAAPDYATQRMSQELIKEDEDHVGSNKKKFRIYEYEMNGNINGRWGLAKDAVKYICPNQQELYYQDYDYFYQDNQNRGKSRAVWNDKADKKKMVLLYGNDLNTYSDLNVLCSGIDNLADDQGYTLHFQFNNPNLTDTTLHPNLYCIDRLKSGLINKPF